MALNLSKNQEDLQRAASDVVSNSSINWAVFGYEGHSNTLQVTATGDGGLEEMADNLSTGSCMYAFCRVKDPKTTLFKYVLIIWQGEGAPDTRRGTCSNHIRPVTALFKGVHLTLTARTEEEVEPDVILEKVAKASSSNFDFSSNNRAVSPPPAPVGSVYKKTVPSVEMSITKEREQFWQRQEKDDTQRQQSEPIQRNLPQDRQPENRKNGDPAKTQVVVPPKPARLAEGLTDAKKLNYVDMERQKWEQTQKSTDNGSSAERKPSLVAARKASFGDVAAPSKGSLASESTANAPLTAAKKGFDPVASARIAEERRRFDQAQKDGASDEKERRLKAESMRQERLKEAQQLIASRGSVDEPAVVANKSRTSSYNSAEPKSRAHSNASGGDDAVTKAYREEERRKFEQSQKESEADERERRLRSESLRQERLRELANLTQKKDTPVDDVFHSIGQSVKEKKEKTTKPGEDPEVVARRKEEQRRWEEAQRETEAEEQERRMRAESSRQERAQEAAALIGGRVGSTKARSLFEQQSQADPVGNSTSTEAPRPSANKVAKGLFETSSTVKQTHYEPAKNRDHDNINQQSAVEEMDRKSTYEPNGATSHVDTRVHGAAYERDSNEASRGNILHDEPARNDNSSSPLPPPYPASDDDHEEIENFTEPFRNGAEMKNGSGDAGAGSVLKDTSKMQKAVSPPAFNAWKQGLPVRLLSDNEDEGDNWNESSSATGVKSPAAVSSGSGSDHGQGMRARALYDYQAADETEISFDPGEIISHIDKVDSGWYQGMSVSGAYGLFPANYVEMIT